MAEKIEEVGYRVTLVYATTQTADVDYCKVPMRGWDWGRKRTVCGFVHDNEAGIDLGGVFSLDKVYRVGMSPEPVGSFKEVDIVRASVQGP